MVAMLQSDVPEELKQTLARKLIYDSPVGFVSAVRTPSARAKWQQRNGARQVKKLEQQVGEDNRLLPESATQYRALSARCNYLSQDRPDIAHSSKELCRDFAAPTGDSMQRLMRMIRYLKGKPRLVYKFARQPRPDH